MGKKPEPPTADVTAKKVISSKPVEAFATVAEVSVPAVPVPEINGAEMCTESAEELVRVGAYFRWDAAGRPGGDGIRFWLEAEQELACGKTPVTDKCLQKS
jgi:hypothetical protein